MKPHRAQINPELLTWARDSSKMTLEYASDKLGVDEVKLASWERGDAQPTIRQLRKLARVYRVNFAAFFLPRPPITFKPPVKDYRRHHEATFSDSDISPDIHIDLRQNLNTREIALELESELGDDIENFSLECSLHDEPSRVAEKLRDALKITFSIQKTFRNSRIAFNEWREAITRIGCLVIQSTAVDLSDMRGYSVYFEQKPLIVVNRKDPYSARTFTLIHELVHILLRSSGLCDLHANTEMPAHEQHLEVFCNKVAAQTLVPDKYLLSYPSVRTTSKEGWTDSVLAPIARDFGVSREVILRKLLDKGLTTAQFYEDNRERYRQEAIEGKKSNTKGFLPPSTDVVSSKGKKFVSSVMDAMNSSIITQSDAADYLGVKAKHFSKIESKL